MDQLFSYLKRNISLAFKSVIFKYRQYLYFFIALFIVQVFFGVLTFAADNNDRTEYAIATTEYDYHLALLGLNEDQYMYLMNDEYAIFSSRKIFEYSDIRERTDSISGEREYDLYIRFINNPASDYDIFVDRYYSQLSLLSENGFAHEKSPLLSFEDSVTANRVTYNLLALLLTVLSALLLMILYNIRINHYKYEYGIYMTFGADFRQLFRTCFWEMIVIALLTYIPATLCSLLFDYIVYQSAGLGFSIKALSPLKVLLGSLFSAGASVLLPIFNVSRQAPMRNIIAEDNSNLVISPRRSFNMLGKSFPRTYELFGMWRFRRYHLRLVFSAALFCLLFIGGCYISSVISQVSDVERVQYELVFDRSGFSDYDADAYADVMAVSGVTGTRKQISKRAPFLRSHVVFDYEDALVSANYVIGNDGENCMTNFVEYIAADAEVAEYLGRYSHEGNLGCVTDDPYSVIISDSTSNTRRLNISVGDKIRIAVFESKIADAGDLTQGNELLERELWLYTFSYIECTVGAIITDLPTDSYLPLYVSNTLYTALTGAPVVYDRVGLYVDPSLGSDDMKRIESELRDLAAVYGNISVSNTHAATQKHISDARNYAALALVISLLLFAVAPMVWFFSQTLFTLKRRGELTVLEAMGALRSEIKRLFVSDGLVIAFFASAVTGLLNWAGLYLMFRFCNGALGTLGVSEARFDFGVPFWMFAASVAAAAICGYLSTFLPFRGYSRERDASEGAYSKEYSSEE